MKKREQVQKREPGIDLIRCVGLFFVVGVHSFLKNGFYSEPQVGAVMWAADSVRWLFYCCNGIFLLLTGYLKSTKPFGKDCFRSLIPVLVGYTLTCVFSFPIRHFLLGEKLTLWQWLTNFITFANYGWYVEMYIGLFLFSPVLNLAMSQLTTKKQWMWLVGTVVLLSALPSVTSLNIIPDYWTALYPVTYYVLGAAIKKWQPKVKPWLALSMAVITAMTVGLITLLTTDETVSKGFGQGYGGFWVTAIGVWIFLGLYRLQPGEKLTRVLAWMAGGCFEGYILSRLLDVWLYNCFKQWHSPEYYPLLFICVTIPIYIFAIITGKITHEIAVKISKKLSC